MASNRLLRRLRPFVIAICGVVCLLLLSLYARSRTVHVVDITSAQDGDVCTIRCRVVNPFHYEVRAVLVASVTSEVGDPELARLQTVAEKTFDVDVPANGSKACELDLECPSTATMLRPQVLVQRIDRTN